MGNDNRANSLTLETARLHLTPLNEVDAQAIFELHSSEVVRKYLDRPASQSLEDAKKFILKTTKGVESGKWHYWAIRRKENPALIGTICLWNISTKNQKAELGYELSPVYSGQGLMQEAIFMIIDIAFKQLNFKVLEAITNVQNDKSIHILERNNFTKHSEFSHYNKAQKMQTKSVKYMLTYTENQ